MPFIRYDTEDLGTKSEESCSCGRNLPLMNSITGRMDDLIRLPDGNVIYGGYFRYALKDSEWITKYGIVQYQVIQKKLNNIVLKIVCQKRPNQQALESLKSLVMKHLGNVTFDIEVVNEILVSVSGKRKTVISEIASQMKDSR